MEVIDKTFPVWKYMSENQQGLILDGEALINEALKDKLAISDYSYLVFPFAKCYEGFLKQVFLDLQLIREEDFYGDDIRIGRILNPHYKHSSSVYSKLCENKKAGKALASKLWETWREGRNRVFHYYPHNFRRLNYTEAMEIIEMLVDAMNEAVERGKLHELIEETESKKN